MCVMRRKQIDSNHLLDDGDDLKSSFSVVIQKSERESKMDPFCLSTCETQ